MRRELIKGDEVWGVAFYHVDRPRFRDYEPGCRIIRAEVGRYKRLTWTDRDGKALMTGWFHSGHLFH